MSVLEEIFGGLDRLAPGSEAATSRIAGSLEWPKEPRILDVGAGTGAQTLVLVKMLPLSHVVALDVSELALATLQRRAEEAGLAGRVTTHVGPMHAMDFPAESFDAVWSEGSAYIMGVANALRKWKPMIKRNGYLVISDCTWLTVAPSAQAQTFWDEAYPAMRTMDKTLALAREAGYTVLGTYVLPPAAWETEYYAAVEPRVQRALEQYESGTRERKTAERVRREIDLFRAHGNEYGYVYYTLQKA